ncbi:helix-turn-helix transcriptional regulator [Robertmurraya beringensis]|jgi:transcriptional regulator with XRE-family HTH domain|uniref:Helix-turn-helix transcriptional regulator n=1 Tax=Robertmurraya beringensis TaxID=641660 RepID=A0ABV6KY63_9BACI
MINTLGNCLRQARLAKNLTQKQVADAIGMSVDSIRYYERDEVQPKRETIEKLLKLYNYPCVLLTNNENYINISCSFPFCTEHTCTY